VEELLDESLGRQAKGGVSEEAADLRVEADVVEGVGELLLDPARGDTHTHTHTHTPSLGQ